MPKITDVEHARVDIDETREHAYNQVNVRRLRNGDLVCVYNEERFPFHHDSGQTVMLRSRDNGATWTDRTVVLPFTDTTGNWDCGICELDDGDDSEATGGERSAESTSRHGDDSEATGGERSAESTNRHPTLLVNFTIAGYFKRGIRPEQPSWSRGPWREPHGDWTWSFKLMSWLGTYTVRSTDGGKTWSDPIPVNARPLKHAGCRLGSWLMPGGELLMGVYGRIRGYGEEGENESTRSALLRSDDGGFNWEYYSTMAFDAASIVDYEEPAIVRLNNGRIVGMLRTHVNPSGDAKNMAMVVSEDDGFSWSLPKFTNIWGYPADFVTLPDGRILMVYGYRRPPYGVRGCLSDDGLTWDVANEFTIREGGVPAAHYDNPGIFQHIGYPSATLLPDGSVLAMYHEHTEEERPIQFIAQTRFRVAE